MSTTTNLLKVEVNSNQEQVLSGRMIEYGTGGASDIKVRTS